MTKPSDTIRALLKLLGYTPKRLATDINITYSQARRILKPDGQIFLDEFEKISEVAGKSLVKLIDLVKLVEGR